MENSKNSNDQKKYSSGLSPSIVIRRVVLPYWFIYIFTLVLGVFAANLYLRSQIPVYQVFGKILLKVNSGSDGEILKELDVFTPQKSVDNELEVIKSSTIARLVAKSLNSYVSISYRGKMADYEERWSFPLHFEAVNEDSMLGLPSTEFTISSDKKYLLILGQKIILRNQLVKFGNDSYYLTVDSNGLKTVRTGNYLININSLENETGKLLSGLSAAQTGKQTTIIAVTYTYPHIDNAKRILNEFIKIYTNSAVEDKRKVAQYTLDFIDDRLHLINRELDSVEKRIEIFKTQNGAVDLSAQGQLYLNSVKGNDEQISKISIKLSILDDIESYISGKGVNPGTVPSVVGFDDPILLNLLTKLYELESEIVKRRKIAGDRDELIVSLKDEILKIKSSISENIRNIRTNLGITKSQLIEKMNNESSILNSLPTKERLLIDIGRQQNIKNEIFTFLLQKREESAIAYASTVSDSRVIEWSYGGTQISPKPGLTYAMFLTFALSIPLFFLIWRIILNPKVLFKDEIESITEIPIIGEIIYDDEKRDFVVGSKDRSVIAESLRTIRTKLSYYKSQGKNKTILVSSSVPNEGKSFFSMNLGISYSLTGKKVLLIGGDMRKPVLHKPFKLSVKRGLSGYLAGSHSLEESIFSTDFDNVFVMPSGIVPPNPSELLESQKFAELILVLKTLYDVIIIDSPPLGLVSDAEILSDFSDVNLFLVRYGVTHKEAVEEVLEKARVSGVFKNISIIFNGIKLTGFGKYGYYGYNYSYGYGGYGYYGSGRKKTGYGYLLKKLFGIK